MSIRVTIVEDHHEFRASLAALINGSPGFACVGAHAHAEETLKLLPIEKPDVLLVDLELPGMAGEELICQVKPRWPRVEILVLTIHDAPERLFESLRAGASGYLVKPVPPAKLLDAIAEVAAGGAPMSSQIARLVIRTFRQESQQREALANLTTREEEILHLMAKGYHDHEIAKHLGISVRTVGTHLHHVYEHLHVRSRTEAAATYLRSR